jgi:hypothetical protein
LTSKFIAKCIEASIDLVNLPLHTLHQLQPLDISIFRPLKRNLTKHLKQRLRNDSQQLQQIEWMKAFIKAHRDSFTVSSVESSFWSAGIYLFDPLVILLKLDFPLPPLPSTPPPRDCPIDPNDALLGNSLLEGSALRQLNNQVDSVISQSNLDTPVRCYIQRSSTLFERVVSENALLRYSNQEKDSLLNVRRTRRKGKQVALKRKHVLRTDEINRSL